MNNFPGLVIIFLAAVLLIKCDDDDKVGSREWPRLNTLEPSDITREGARFNAGIIYRGDSEILRLGFVWSTGVNPVIENDDRKILSGNITQDKFSALITTTLDDGAKYSVRAFVETRDFTVYGNVVTFLSKGSGAPNIISFNPVSGSFNDTVYIKGENFSFIPSANKVRFENPHGPNYGTSGAQIISASDTLLVVKVPLIVYETSVKVNVTILHWTATSDQTFRFIQ